ncbi:MAG: hypothetical protein IT445_21020 [Phycisphaeraceae bacterium]|nr:hypothetical protein [Phycisphaeraceae bacterium]
MANTQAIHWIATTHGTWLHGDVRGSWRNGKLIGPDPFLEEAIQQRMAHDAVVLSPGEIVMVACEIGRTVIEQQQRVLAATIQPTHLHLVLAPLREDVKKTIARFMKRTADLVLAVRHQCGKPCLHLWTQGQFPVFIFDDDHLCNAIDYVRRHNTRCGRSADPYDWIDPLFPPDQPRRKPGQNGPAI